MIALNKRVHPLVESETSAQTERLCHEVRQTLRATGVPLPLRALAARERFFSLAWGELQRNAETRAFEEGADRLREEAVHAAARMDRLSVLGRAQLGESQAFQAEAALLALHYLDPKLLLLWSALASALEDTPAPVPGQGRGSSELVERGAPARMAPLELLDEPAEDEAVRKVFRDARRALGCSELSQDLRALALWPRYLAPAWQRLKPVVRSPDWQAAGERLLALSRELARTLPHPVTLPRERLAAEGVDAAWELEQARSVEQELSGLTMNMALLILDWQAPELARRSPFPAPPRAARPQEAL